MKQPDNLHLLIIDDNQLYAERLIDVLEENYYKKVSLGFLDDKEELLKLLRQSWDILIMGKAYDLTLPQVIKIIKEQELDLPIIGIIPENGINTKLLDAKDQTKLEMVQDDDKTDIALPLYAHWGAVDALPKERVMEMALRVYQEHRQRLIRDDLTKLRQVLKDAEQRANILIKNSKSAVAYVEEGLHIYANQPYLEMFGFQSMDDLMGVPIIDLIASNNIKDFKNFLKDFEKGNRKNVEFQFESVRKDGSTFDAKLQLAAATYEGEPCQQVIIQPDENNNAELAKKLAQMERIDQLTGIFNRRGFEQVLTSVREVVVQKGLLAGVLSVRIDDIGKINSSLGIQGVDSVVIAIANLLKQKIATIVGEDKVDKGYVSRFSDSQFMLILPNMPQEQIEELGNQIVAEIGETLIEVGARTVKTTVTVGATMINSTSPEAPVIIDRVLQALGLALKDNVDGNVFYLYDPSAFASEDDAVLLETLRNAIEHNKFTLMYQPIYDVERDTSSLFEVFLRLPLADGTLMTPDKFLHVANQHGLMDKIDRWVLINACKNLKRYRTEVDASARIMVHLSAASLTDESLSAFVTKLLQAIGGDETGRITLQFNETMVNDYMAMSQKQAEMLKQVGCDVGLYSFGSAVNSMEILDFIKPNIVRLDRSYIKDLENSDNVETISSLIAQIHEHGASSLMAFIQDPAAMSAAWTVGAKYLQGNYLQEPSKEMKIKTEQA
ncbi:diguanylate cyclase/phosphodiesterase [Moraxella macacae 0408225]|uniref:Diguanylate cyclase/phosphodiesterase n=1 Tax=Moraxella macacae 0408225 TaxID=1230338 RepID=L2F9R4_9GAMM|nr:EAL domain-containing protein [Moraxella macacae]ELA09625.1 diguanylate cyclase/phosphodiesterase [Moraxella macacae 0408225]